MNMQVFIPIIAAVVAAAVTAFFSRRRNQAEIDKLVINNVKDVVSIYKTAIDDLTKEVHSLREEVKALRIKLGISAG